MVQALIQKYITKLTEKEISSFAQKNGVSLTKEEQVLLLSSIKKEWHTILYGNPEKIFAEIQPKLNPLTYEKMVELYTFFKEKYQDYL